jgi:DNA-binding NarL/FixJ family response regulator
MAEPSPRPREYPSERPCEYPSESTRVLIADDSERIRRGLRGLFDLTDDIEVVAEAADGAQAVALAAEFVPDIVVMDVGMPVMDGIAATRLLQARQPAVRVLIVTALPGQEGAARRAGSAGFLLKDADPAEILEAIRSLAEPMPLRP